MAVDILCHCHLSLSSDILYHCGQSVVLQAIKSVKPNFRPDSKSQRIDYTSPLLSSLNNSTEVLIFSVAVIHPNYVTGFIRNFLYFSHEMSLT